MPVISMRPLTLELTLEEATSLKQSLLNQTVMLGDDVESVEYHVCHNNWVAIDNAITTYHLLVAADLHPGQVVARVLHVLD